MEGVKREIDDLQRKIIEKLESKINDFDADNSPKDDFSKHISTDKIK